MLKHYFFSLFWIIYHFYWYVLQNSLLKSDYLLHAKTPFQKFQNVRISRPEKWFLVAFLFEKKSVVTLYNLTWNGAVINYESTHKTGVTFGNIFYAVSTTYFNDEVKMLQGHRLRKDQLSFPPSPLHNKQLSFFPREAICCS